jgi:hypothetical protein
MADEVRVDAAEPEIGDVAVAARDVAKETERIAREIQRLPDEGRATWPGRSVVGRFPQQAIQPVDFDLAR